MVVGCEHWVGKGRRSCDELCARCSASSRNNSNIPSSLLTPPHTNTTPLSLHPQGGGELALPPHRISANDIARLLPNRGPAGSAALCDGVVVRVRDDSLVLAVDEVPDSGLEVPLRLEKLANTVTYDRMKAALSVWWCFSSKGWETGGLKRTAGCLAQSRTPSMHAHCHCMAPKYL